MKGEVLCQSKSYALSIKANWSRTACAISASLKDQRKMPGSSPPSQRRLLEPAKRSEVILNQ